MEEMLVFQNGDGQIITNSVLVAKKFGKKHDNVLRSIRSILNGGVLKNDETPMFEESTYHNAQNGQTYPMFLMNRDGFTLLAMGFTGNQAMQFKIDYISAFNKMESVVKHGTSLKPKTANEMFLMQAQINIEQEKRIVAIEERLDKIEEDRKENGRLLLEAQVSGNPVPAMTMRKSIIALVNEYSAASNTKQQDVWHSVYNDLYYRYGKSINSYKRLLSRESKLDIAERNGLLEPIFDIISDMIVKWRGAQK